jgi:hypothetical protein
LDLIRAIRILKSKLPITVRFEHIYGHQDDLLAYNYLPRMAQLNVEMDYLAKDRVLTLFDSRPAAPCPSSIAHEGWSCSIQGVKITSHPAEAIRHAVFGTKLCNFLADKNRLSRVAFAEVDWEAMSMASDHFPPLYRLWVSKHVSGFFGIGTMMYHWEFWDHSRCPCCDHPCEDKIHLLTCPHPSCADAWHDSLLGLEAWMIDADTDPAIRECIILGLDARNPAQSFTDFSNPRTLMAAQAQDRIGWMHTTDGKLSSRWRQLQAGYYSSTNSRQSAAKWAAGLVANILSVTHAQWIHRCAVLHERDAQGLKLQDSQALAAAIQEQFHLGVDGLRARDHHYLTRGRDVVEALPADSKQGWLSGVRIARQLYLESEAHELHGMRNIMLQWLASA